MVMKEIRVQDAIGRELCQDIMKIVNGTERKLLFRKGHIIQQEDIRSLRGNGCSHVYIWEDDDSMVHQNEAVGILYSACANEHMHPSPIEEGMLQFFSDTDGLLVINKDLVDHVNTQGEVIITTRHSGSSVCRGDVIAGIGVIPLVIEKNKINHVQEILNGARPFSILPFAHKKVGLLITGEDVRSGMTEDKFTGVLCEKLSAYDTEVIGRKVTDDNNATQISALRELLSMGADMIVCAGGTGVEPDDRTSFSIRVVADRVVSYGVPMMPGPTFMVAYCGDDLPIVGVSSCMMSSKRTAFDLILPYIMADVPVTPELIASFGYGGLCLNCEACRFPNCAFGKR